MEPPEGVLASVWHFICFLPYFIGLLLLGIIKGIIFCPLTCLILTFGNSGIILGLLPVYGVWTYYSVLRAKQLGPVLKLVVCLAIPVLLILWTVEKERPMCFSTVFTMELGALSRAALLLSRISKMFVSIPTSQLWMTCKSKSHQMENAMRSVGVQEVLYSILTLSWQSVLHNYQQPVTRMMNAIYKLTSIWFLNSSDGWQLDFGLFLSEMTTLICFDVISPSTFFRLLLLPGAIIAAVLGLLIDFPVISIVALGKSPYMLFKGWHRLFHDLIGREGPFLETICVPFAGLAILLWPLAVVGAVLGSMVASIFLGAFAGVVVYQESSFWFGLCYIVASLSIYDEYSNDIIDMREGSCFPRPQFRRQADSSKTASQPTTSQMSSFSRPRSLKNVPSHSLSISFANPMVDLKPLELLDSLFKECQRHGEIMVSEGLITPTDIEDAKSSKGSRVVSIGLPAYCLLQCLLHSAQANSAGILLSDDMTEITPSNRPKDTFFDWFLNPILIIKEQIKAENLSEEEEEYLGKLVLLCGDPARLKNSNIGSPPESERKRAELDALARRLQGITKSISRYPTYRRHFEILVKTLLKNLAQKNDGSRSSNRTQTIQRSKSAFPA
ncbi:hypothetical protein SLEP1_g19566 [Rubroshorea leprosula]|uniref:Steroid nuclear receptor ligand-binding n=1 Tax=Rubroshorea leprosula TaxID=152421 RepID=A0AAV5JAD7_9ROSI|nr:hypothetical protein SLEP1_g19566 [Rubroshorea leprosula]